MPVLKAMELVKAYRQGDATIYAVNNANAVVEAGDFVVLTGASGSGKSTFLNLCAGILKPTAGKIFIDGADIASMKFDELAVVHRCKTGIVFQNYDLLSMMTVRENIMLPSILDKRRVDRHHFNELAEMLGLEDRLDHFPDELSGGQQQRVAIARALINYPAILFADEPTGNLDADSAEEILNLFLQINRSGTTVMLITHDMGIRDRILAEAPHPVWLHMENGEMRRKTI